MKTFNLIAKILAALAAVAGTVYVIATYGDKIVAWAKSVLPTVEKVDDEQSPFRCTALRIGGIKHESR